jgi:hypothetical protein
MSKNPTRKRVEDVTNPDFQYEALEKRLGRLEKQVDVLLELVKAAKDAVTFITEVRKILGSVVGQIKFKDWGRLMKLAENLTAAADEEEE